MKREARAGLRTWIEIDTSALAHNFKIFRRLVKKPGKLLVVAKSNAYGHSIRDYAAHVEALGADWIGVDSIVEGVALREHGIKVPILVMGYTLPERFTWAAENNISLTISTFESLFALVKNAKSKKKKAETLRIHIKIDTGMHRQGFLPDDLPRLVRVLKTLPPSVLIEGVYTHLAAKDPAVLRTNKDQLRCFDEVRRSLDLARLHPIFHAAATWGALAYPDMNYDMTRIGMGMYGYFPSAPLKTALGDRFPLRPILEWKTIISEVKKLPLGGGVGYDLTEELPAGARIGICPIGYWHGYPRALSSTGFVLVRGVRAKVVGRVSMDIIVVDLSNIPAAKVADEVVLIGRQGRESVSAEELGTRASTTAYEILTRINPLIKRFYI